MQQEEMNSQEEKSPMSADTNQAELPDAQAEVTDMLAKLEAEKSEAKNDYLRLMAEFDNYKKRSKKEKEEYLKYASSSVIMALLPVIDDFDLAVQATSSSENDTVSEGMLLIHKKMRSILESLGLKPIEAFGQPFDTELHDAIGQVPAPTEKEKGCVITELKKGYFLHERVIRHAQVFVGV